MLDKNSDDVVTPGSNGRPERCQYDCAPDASRAENAPEPVQPADAPLKAQSQETNIFSLHRILGHVNRTWITAGALTALIIVFGVSTWLPAVPPLAKELILGLIAAVTMHLLDRIWLHRDTKEEYNHVANRIEAEIVNQFRTARKHIVQNVLTVTSNAEIQFENVVEKIASDVKVQLNDAINAIPTGAKSLEAMRRAGAGQLYSSRHEASVDIFSDFNNPNTEKIRMIGVSFHDTLRRSGSDELGQTWEQIFDHINGKQTYSTKTDIKLLVIDPRCHGALLRAEGESRVGGKFLPGGLQADVREAIQPLLELQREAARHGVKFEARVYRTSPILFLCWNERVAYTQQYFFWSERAKADDPRMPMIRFESGRVANKSVHSELEQHFDWIWDNASVGLERYQIGHEIGADEGICRTGIANVLADPADGRKRITHLLSTAEKRVRVQGISLHSYFAQGDLQDALRHLLAKPSVDLGIYFLDPDCEQAQFRAFREMCLRKKTIPWSTYVSNPALHRQSTLYRDTINAKTQLGEMIAEISRVVPNWNPSTRTVECGVYKTAPSCFVLQVDDTVLVEQYHYGKLMSRDHEARFVLGMDLPLIEYRRERSKLFTGAAPPVYGLLDSHLDFVSELSEKFAPGWWNTSQVVDG